MYIGEPRDLTHRLAGNFGSPGNSQQTSLRVNALLRDHTTQILIEAIRAVASGQTFWPDAIAGSSLDAAPPAEGLGPKAGRVTYEDAVQVSLSALSVASSTGRSDSTSDRSYGSTDLGEVEFGLFVCAG